MPLLFNRHRPPELDQEIRALWRSVDRLQTNAIAAGGGGTQGPPGPPGETETLRGTVHSWIQLIEVGPLPQSESPFSATFAPNLPVPITGGYTHLDAWVSVAQQGAGSVATFAIRGNCGTAGAGFFRYVPAGEPLDHSIIDQDPVFYDTVPVSGLLGAGQVLLLPTPYGGGVIPFDFRLGLSYFPIKTVSGVDDLRVEFGLVWGSDTGCFKGFVQGRYVLHESLLFARGTCPAE